ncbi:hypothetical protein lpari_00422 [Legionella parisiensis]|uniref:Uncharacterized protein n=1 Tax=Legionella parisiensis TaxID=45071 RepID=A0A1E5JWS1_9GAMM|nr:hypothetical protein lpari_00422 [Legionella parisiensis]STX77130.1 Uncharacterised protein [Legionella parisiensis]
MLFVKYKKFPKMINEDTVDLGKGSMINIILNF